MKEIQCDISLQPYSTFMVHARAKFFASFSNIPELQNIVRSESWQDTAERLVIGEGSNILFTKDYDGFVLKNEMTGITITDDDSCCSITLRVAAGENWHDLVMYTVMRDWWGLENLALIPGTVGGAPVQNIGAYGAEVADRIVQIEAVHLTTGEAKTFTKDECDFEYRSSFFKKHAGEYMITYVYFRVELTGTPNESYGRIADEIRAQNLDHPTPLQIAEIISSIRRSKLPDVGEIGMAGSFFKNPVITKKHFEKLQTQHPAIRYFELDDGDIKIPAAWLIEAIGLKGAHEGNVGTYDKHALVLVNHCDASGEEVWEFAQKIMKIVQDQFDITLEPEVNII